MDNESGEGAGAQLSDTGERNPTGGVSRRTALGVAGVSVAGALLPTAHVNAAEASVPSSAPTTLTAARVAVIAGVARAMASVPVMLPHRAGRDLHPLDRASEGHIRTLAAHLTPSQMALTCQGADVMAAAGIGSASPSAVASAIVGHTDWDGDAGVAAVLQLATAVSTPLGFSEAFPSAWRTLLRTRSWPMITPTASAVAS